MVRGAGAHAGGAPMSAPTLTGAAAISAVIDEIPHECLLFMALWVMNLEPGSRALATFEEAIEREGPEAVAVTLYGVWRQTVDGADH